MVSALLDSVDCDASFELACWCCAFEDNLTAALRRRSRARASCEDALQDLWQAVLLAPPPDEVVGDEGRLFGWLLDVARKRLIDHLRRENRHRHAPLLDDIAGSNDAEREENDAEREENDAEREENVRQVRATLTAMHAGGEHDAAQLLEWRFIDGRSVKSIARELGITPNTASARIQRAKPKFAIAWPGGVAIERVELFRRICASHFSVSCDY